MRPKALGFLLLGLFLAYQAVRSTLLLLALPTLSWPVALFAAIALNLFVTGAFAFPGFVLPTRRLLPENYYRIKRSKQLRTLYNRLGVAHFRQFLLATFWRSRTKQKSFFNGTRAGLRHFVNESRQAEFGHLGAGVVLLIVGLLLFIYDQKLIALFTTVINIIFNGYPVVLQRFHRVRIERIIERVAP